MTNTDRVEPGPFSEWQSQTLAFLMSTFAAEHTYVSRFVDLTHPSDGVSGPMGEHRDGGLGVLRAVREDVVDGYLRSLRDLISAEVFSDFLDMADHLLTEGYHHAAASLAGAVLEDGLRRTLAGRGAKATGNLESMNQIALDQNVYGPMVFKQVKVWIDIRNDADHGQFESVDPDRVRSMVRDLPAFIARDLELG